MIEKSKKTIEVDVYKTTDGKTFECKEKAVDHQRVLQLVATIPYGKRPYGFADRGLGYQHVKCENHTLIDFTYEIISNAAKTPMPEIIEKDLIY